MVGEGLDGGRNRGSGRGGNLGARDWGGGCIGCRGMGAA